MSDYHFAVVPRCQDPAWLATFEALAAISGAHQIDVLGHDELNAGGTVRQAGYQLQEDYRHKLVVAAGEGPPAGPLSELTDTAATILGFAECLHRRHDCGAGSGKRHRSRTGAGRRG